MMTRFKKGDKVVPVNKTDGCAFYDCMYWRRANEKNQPYLFVISVTMGLLICSDVETDITGNNYKESDLIFYEKMVEGEIIEVRESEDDDWTKRCFITKLESSENKNINKPYICVTGSIDGDVDYQRYKEGKVFDTTQWRYARKILKITTVTARLNDKYTAIVSKDKIEVGCQEFTFDAIKNVYEQMVKFRSEE